MNKSISSPVPTEWMQRSKPQATKPVIIDLDDYDMDVVEVEHTSCTKKTDTTPTAHIDDVIIEAKRWIKSTNAVGYSCKFFRQNQLAKHSKELRIRHRAAEAAVKKATEEAAAHYKKVEEQRLILADLERAQLAAEHATTLATRALRDILYDQKRVRELKGSIEDIETIHSSQESSQGDMHVVEENNVASQKNIHIIDNETLESSECNLYSIEDAPQPCPAPELTDDESSLPMDW